MASNTAHHGGRWRTRPPAEFLDEKERLRADGTKSNTSLWLHAQRAWDNNVGAHAGHRVRNAGLSINKKSLVAILLSKLDCAPSRVCQEACYANRIGADWPVMIRGCEISSTLKLGAPRLVQDMICAINTGAGLETGFLNGLAQAMAQPVAGLRPVPAEEFRRRDRHVKLKALVDHGFFPLPFVKIADVGDFVAPEVDASGSANQIANLLALVRGCPQTFFWQYTRQLSVAQRLHGASLNLRVILSLDASTPAPTPGTYSGALSYLFSPSCTDMHLPQHLLDPRVIVIFPENSCTLPSWGGVPSQVSAKVCPSPSCTRSGNTPACLSPGCGGRCRLPRSPDELLIHSNGVMRSPNAIQSYTSSLPPPGFGPQVTPFTGFGHGKNIKPRPESLLKPLRAWFD